jgi:putative transposase
VQAEQQKQEQQPQSPPPLLQQQVCAVSGDGNSGDGNKKDGSRIADAIKATRARHRSMACHIYRLKIDSSHAGAAVTRRLQGMFMEAKWLYNYTLSQPSPYTFDYKLAAGRDAVTVKKSDGCFEPRTIESLSAQMMQDVVKRIHNSINALSALKKKGYSVGRLKFKSRVDSIPLRAHGQTYAINRQSSRIKIQGIKKRLRVRGVGQIPENAELANATLVRKASGYYVYVTAYTPVIPVEHEQVADTGSTDTTTTTAITTTTTTVNAIGIDFGLHNQLALSNGIVVQYGVNVARKKVRRLHRELTRRQATRGRNWWKTKLKLDRQYEHTTSIKADIRNKIVACITGNYDVVCIQRDDVKSWQQMKLPARAGKKMRRKKRGRRRKGWSGWSGGRVILDTAIGVIMSALRVKAKVKAKTTAHTRIVEVPAEFRSTETCHRCKNTNPVKQGERTYRCASCGLVMDRDVNAAINIREEGTRKLTPTLTLMPTTSPSPLLLPPLPLPPAAGNINRDDVPTGRREFTPVDIGTSTLDERTPAVLDKLNSVSPVWMSASIRWMKQEAHVFRHG